MLAVSLNIHGQVSQSDLTSSVSRAGSYLNRLPDSVFISYNQRLLFVHIHLMYDLPVGPRQDLLEFEPRTTDDIPSLLFFQSIVRRGDVVGRDSLFAHFNRSTGLDRLMLWGANAHVLALDSMTLATFRWYSGQKRDVRGVAHAALAIHWAGFTAGGRWDHLLTPIAESYEMALRQGVTDNGIVDDSALEGLLGLVCIRKSRDIPLAWIARVINAQNPDGGWTWELTGPRTSNPHTTLLALWVLAEVGAG
jgi:hypothetical protein